MQQYEPWENDEIRFGRVSRFLDSLNQCRELGIKVTCANADGLELELPYSEHIVGDTDTGVIHGGAITTLMDTASGGSVLCCLPELELCPTLDLRVDYMRPAQPGKTVFARARCYRVTGTIVFTRCEAFQRGPDTTVANCVATFMRIGRDASPDWFWEKIEGRK
ncbi:hotdog fold thioesterase [Hahella sp. KA22]|uniref:PaaI family thioesterase n=1 Tax=Hahella sp. KA22 TaxID=1628392 RepID=UPI000FDE977B|nr:PaaI family thioesterase [Hahella sp. KA22]AZZ91175.1 PaaI family thioesterase [Hahella sp. KA22]QAY54543.1 hotdog fold thioesterase [Hahella sp. KA22]